MLLRIIQITYFCVRLYLLPDEKINIEIDNLNETKEIFGSISIIVIYFLRILTTTCLLRNELRKKIVIQLSFCLIE